MEHVCLNCGKIFSGKPPRKYCSHKCFSDHCLKNKVREKHHRYLGHTTRTCEQCGKVFEITVRLLRKGRGRFCSLGCWHSFHKGKNHSNWKGDLTPFRQSIYISIEWKELYHKILEKFKYRCYLCDKNYSGRDKKMEVHHLKPLSEYWWMPFVESNLVLLCKDCHVWVHGNENIYNLLKEDWVINW